MSVDDQASFKERLGKVLESWTFLGSERERAPLPSVDQEEVLTLEHGVLWPKRPLSRPAPRAHGD